MIPALLNSTFSSGKSATIAAANAATPAGGRFKRLATTTRDDHRVAAIMEAMRQRFADTTPAARHQDRVATGLHRCSLHLSRGAETIRAAQHNVTNAQRVSARYAVGRAQRSGCRAHQHAAAAIHLS
jgi:hypothetical protein